MFDEMGLLERLLNFVEHNATRPYENHHCGDPDSTCDCNCSEAAEDSKLLRDLQELIRLKKEESKS